MKKEITLGNIKDILVVPTNKPKDTNQRDQFLTKYGKNLKMIKEIKKAIVAKEKELEVYVKDHLLDEGDKVYIGNKDNQVSISLSQPKAIMVLDKEALKEKDYPVYQHYLKEVITLEFDEEKFFNEDKELYNKYLVEKKAKPTISFSKNELLGLINGGEKNGKN